MTRIRFITSALSVAMLAMSLPSVAMASGRMNDIRLVSHLGQDAGANGGSFEPSVSGDAQWVAFESEASNLVSSDTNSASDIFVVREDSTVMEPVSVVSAGSTANGASWDASISSDGGLVVFTSESSDLVGEYNPAAWDVFLRNRASGSTILVSKGLVGPANGSSWSPEISGSGRFVVFVSAATNLVASDQNGLPDVFIYDSVSGHTELVSRSLVGSAASGESNEPAISFDGRYVAFASNAEDIASTRPNGVTDVFLLDREAGVTAQISVPVNDLFASNGDSFAPTISGNGKHVGFVSTANNLSVPDVNGFADVFVYDVESGDMDLVSKGWLSWPANGPSTSPSLGWDGKKIAFQSSASNLAPHDDNGLVDVFVLDFHSARPRLISSNGVSGGSGISASPSMSFDGSRIAFESAAEDLVFNDANDQWDVFVSLCLPTD